MTKCQKMTKNDKNDKNVKNDNNVNNVKNDKKFLLKTKFHKKIYQKLSKTQ